MWIRLFTLGVIFKISIPNENLRVLSLCEGNFPYWTITAKNATIYPHENFHIYSTIELSHFPWQASIMDITMLVVLGKEILVNLGILLRKSRDNKINDNIQFIYFCTVHFSLHMYKC